MVSLKRRLGEIGLIGEEGSASTPKKFKSPTPMINFLQTLTASGGGTLAESIKKRGGSGGLPEIVVRGITRYILMGLNYVDAYSQLCPHNIFLVFESSYMAKILDFGKKEGGCSCVKYLSPEAVVNGELESGCNIWALGCIVLEMLTGKSLWGEMEDSEVERFLCRIGKGEGFLELSRKMISKEARSFLRGCLARQVEDRLTAEELLNHPFVALFSDDFEVEVENPDFIPVEDIPECLDFIPLENEEKSEFKDDELLEKPDSIPLRIDNFSKSSDFIPLGTDNFSESWDFEDEEGHEVVCHGDEEGSVSAEDLTTLPEFVEEEYANYDEDKELELMELFFENLC